MAKKTRRSNSVHLFDSFPKIDISHSIHIGADNRKAENQDTAIIIENFMNNKKNTFVGVFDGHGMHGKMVSAFVRDLLPKVLEGYLSVIKEKKKIPLKGENVPTLAENIPHIDSGNPQNITELRKKLVTPVDALKLAFEYVDQKLVEAHGNQVVFSGSTGTVVVIIGATMYVANAGDSRCVLAQKTLRQSVCFCGQKIETDIKTISVDHRPDLSSERLRIIDYGGYVKPSLNSTGRHVGCARIYQKNNRIPGLAVSRGFGDVLATSLGCIVTPDVEVIHLNTSHAYTMLGSDGVWDVMRNSTVRKIISGVKQKKAMSSEEHRKLISEVLMKKVLQEWSFRRSADNVSFVILWFGDWKQLDSSEKCESKTTILAT